MSDVGVHIEESDDWEEFVSANRDEPTSGTSRYSPNPVNVRNSPNHSRNSSNDDGSLAAVEPNGNDHHAGLNTLITVPVENSSPSLNPSPPVSGLNELDHVQRYALGALVVVLMHRHAIDLNGIAFARTHCLGILEALNLSPGQRDALLALDPSDSTRDAMIAQCVELIGDISHRFLALQAMLVLAVASGTYDARSRAFLNVAAHHFDIPWPTVAAVELAIAYHLMEQHNSRKNLPSSTPTEHLDNNNNNNNSATCSSSSSSVLPLESTHPISLDAQEGGRDIIVQTSSVSHSPVSSESNNSEQPLPTVDQLLIKHRKKKQRLRKAVKIGGITLIGGVLFGLTGGLIAPALLSALAGVGVASATGLAASGTLASGAVVGGLFGVAGGGFTLRKARNRISTNLDEFDFEHSHDPRVIEERQFKEDLKRKRMERTAARRAAEEAVAQNRLLMGTTESADTSNKSEDVTPDEGEMPDIVQFSSEEENRTSEDNDRLESKSSQNKRGTKTKKREKLKVCAKGLKGLAEIPSLHIVISVPAWLSDRSFGSGLDQFEPALKMELPYSQHIALRWESKRLYEMGLAFAKFWASKATVTTVQQAYPHAVAAASSVAGAVAFAFAAPLTVMSCMDYIDNPWSVLVSRSNGAGEELADVLVERSYGNRPVSLFGYSIGARVVFKCLESLVSRGAFGIVDNVYMMGAAVSADSERWKKVRPVIAGRIVNAYCPHDWALAFFHRGCGHGFQVAGLRRVEVDGVENLNMAFLGIEGHRELKDSVPRVMRAMGVGLGYISIPPARLVMKGTQKASNEDLYSETAVCEQIGATDLKKDSGSECVANFEVDQTQRPHSDGTIGYSFEEPGGAHSSNAMKNGIETVESEKPVSKKSKSHKSKSWLPWNISHKSSRKNGKSSKVTDETDELEARIEKESKRLEQMCEEVQRAKASGTKRPSFDISTNESCHSLQREGGRVIGNEQVYEESIDTRQHADTSDNTFVIFDDTDEGDINAGVTDLISMQGRMALNISVEVAGRRLERFIDQDAQFPVDRKEMVFTNCSDDQQGMHIRVYEHLKRNKSVSCNTLKNDKAYPKQIADIEFRLRAAAVKGKLRVCVAMSADESGNVYVSAEERFADGSFGEKEEVCIFNSELCSLAERFQMEEVEASHQQSDNGKEESKEEQPPALLTVNDSD